MSRAIAVLRGGPLMSVQDLGRPGFLANGLSAGGAADRTALFEGAALLGQDASLAALELVGAGGVFEAEGDLRIALTGAPMDAAADGRPLAWNASHRLPGGTRLTIGGAREGVFGYLHVGGGITTPTLLGARALHSTAGLGHPPADGDILPVGPDRPGADTGLGLPPSDRFGGGEVRVVPSLQTARFSEADLARLEATVFTRDRRGNRMGVRLTQEGPGFFPEGGLSVLSEAIVPGDIQITGDGRPFVLLADCQTTGGYPRIATVIPPDLVIVAQARVGTAITFRFIGLDEADAAARAHRAAMAALPKRIERLVLRPEDVPDLLTRQLISGVTRGDDL